MQAMRQGHGRFGVVGLCPSRRRRRRRRFLVAASTAGILLLWTLLSLLLPQPAATATAGPATTASFCTVTVKTSSPQPDSSSKVIVPRRSDGYRCVSFTPRRTARPFAAVSGGGRDVRGGAGFGKNAAAAPPSLQKSSSGERRVGGGGGQSEDGGGGSSSSSSSWHGQKIYSKPSLYDLAFGYRDYDEEVAFLLGAHVRHSRRDGVGEGAGGGNDAGSEGLRVLELAAGPARHSLAALDTMTAGEASGGGEQVSVRHATAVDVSDEMMEYGLDLAREQRRRTGGNGSLRIVNDDEDGWYDDECSAGGCGGSATFEYVLQDMRHLDLMSSNSTSTPPLYDTAWMLLGSMQHLLTNDDVVSCLSSLHRHLSPDGTVVIELPHPEEAVFNALGCTKNSWVVPLDLSSGGGDDSIDVTGGEGEVEEEAGTLKVLWGDANDPFDPVRQVRQFSVGLELTTTTKSTATAEESDSQRRGRKSKRKTRREERERTSVKEVVPLRVFTAQEVDALARCAGFEVAAMYGALDADVGVDDTDDEQAYRMVCVLRKRH